MASTLAASKPRSRVRNPGGSIAVGLRVSHLLRSIDLEPSGMPPAATLIVRRFSDPLPRGLQSDASALVPSSAWEQAARAGLSGFTGRAAWPALGSVPASAEAVLFADEGELLACLSLDLLRGAAASLWWWRAMLRTLSSPTQRGVFEAWRRDARYVPAALAHLAARGEAEWVLNTFSAAQAWSVFEEVTRAFEIESLCAVSQLRSWSSSWSSSQSISAAGSPRPTDVADVISATPLPDAPSAVSPPWRDVLAESLVSSRLGRERMALLGVSLVLSRAPSVARSQRFTEVFSRWYPSARAGAVHQIETNHLVESDAKGPGFDVSATQLSERRPTNAVDALRDSQLDAKSSAVEARVSEEGSEQHAIGRGAKGRFVDANDATGSLIHRNTDGAAELYETVAEAPASEKRSAKRALQPEPGLNPKVETVAGSDPCAQSLLASATVESLLSDEEMLQTTKPIPPAVPAIDASEGVATELGGVLFLINVLKALRLPDSLEDACDCQLGLGSWESVELMARCLLGAGPASLASDPMWTILATLEGRSPEQKAGAHFVPASCYRLPSDWIPAPESGHLQNDLAIRIRGHQLEIWHRLGFPCAIRQVDQPPSRSQLEREMHEMMGGEIRETEESFGPATCSFLRRYPRRWAVGRPLDFVPDRPLVRFLSFLLPSIRWRLAAAVGQQTTQQPLRAKTVLLRTGRIWVTPTHVDLVMDLAQATGAVRLAGLDADPGWVPELGRVVKFHFR